MMIAYHYEKGYRLATSYGPLNSMSCKQISKLSVSLNKVERKFMYSKVILTISIDGHDESL